VNVAVVTIAHGRHEHLLRQQQSLLAGSLLPSAYVVVAMDDAALEHHRIPGVGQQVLHLPPDPRGLPLARARNLGVEAAARTGADAVVLLDVDCMAGRDLVAGYADAVNERPDVVWSGPVTYLPPSDQGYDVHTLADHDRPHPARPAPEPGQLVLDAPADLFWSLSFAVHPVTWERVGGFCEDYVGYGAEDTDFGYQAAARGVELGWAGTPRAYHQHHPTSDPPLEHLDDILRNGRLFSRRWGTWPMTGWIEDFARRGLIVRDADGDWRRTDEDATYTTYTL
jgi:hypothetical protein